MNLSEMIQALKEAQDSAPKPFDTPAEVVRVEGETAWVQIPGSDDETPVNLTIAAKEGDTVQVRVSGGTAFLVGNATAPPTDDTEAYVAQARAEEVQADLNEQKEYFWHDDDGAHIQGNLSGYRNDLKSDGMYITETETGTEVASFSTTLIELGKNAVGSIISFCKDTFRIVSGQTHTRLLAQGTYNSGGVPHMDIQIMAQHTIGNDSETAEILAYASAANQFSEIYLQADYVEFRNSNVYFGTRNVTTPDGKLVAQSSTTTWTYPTASGASRDSGGYYAEGKHVYVSIQCKLSSAASSGDNVTLFTGLTAPLFMVPLEVMVANQRNGVAWINDSGELHFRPTASVSTSNAVIINGHYTSA